MEIINVAIVEDVEEIRNALRILINGFDGFRCDHAYSTAEDALINIPSVMPDVVLMDVHLPGKNGIECVKELKKLCVTTQFMMCTVYDDDDNIFEALRAGATGYLLKRTSPARMLEAIRDLHAGGSPMSSEIVRRVVVYMQQKDKPSLATETLTQREKEILNYLSKGYLYKEIADKLFVSKETVKKHIHNIYDKLHVQTRTDALNKAFRR